MALEQQFEHVLQFIDEHLSENLSIEILADSPDFPDSKTFQTEDTYPILTVRPRTEPFERVLSPRWR